MVLGNALGIPFTNNKIGKLKPCLTGQTYWSYVLADGLLTDKDTTRGNDAKLIDSNCLTFDGITTIDLGDVYNTQNPHVRFIGRLTTTGVYNYIFARTTTSIEYLLYQTASKFRFLIADASNGHTVYLVDSTISINTTDFFEIIGYYDRVNYQIVIRARNLTTGGAWIENTTAATNTVLFSGSTNAVIGYDDVTNVRQWIGQMALLEIKDYLTDEYIDKIPFSSNTNPIHATVTGSKYPIANIADYPSLITQDFVHEKMNNGYSDYLLFGNNGYAAIGHSHDDEVFLFAYVHLKFAGPSVLLNTGVGSTIKGIYLSTTAALKLTWAYANGTGGAPTGVETWESTGSPVLLNNTNRIEFHYKSGVFTVRCNNVIDTSTVTIAPFVGNSSHEIRLNTGTYAAMYEPRLEVNGVYTPAQGIPAMDANKTITADGLRVQFSQYKTNGVSLDIIEGGQSNIAGAGDVSEIDADIYRYAYSKVRFWSHELSIFIPAAAGVNTAGLGASSVMYGAEMALAANITNHVDLMRGIKESQGGSRAWQWETGTLKNYFDSLITNAIAAGLNPRIFRWGQGESNTEYVTVDPSDPDYEYKNSISADDHNRVCRKNFIYLKKLFPGIKIIAQKLSTFMTYKATGIAAINSNYDAMLAEGIIDAVQSTELAPIIDDGSAAAGHHYTYEGNNIIGYDFAQILIGLFNLQPLSTGSKLNVVLECETNIDFTNEGANTEINTFFNNIIPAGIDKHPAFNISLFANTTIDDLVSDIMIYENPLTGKCLLKALAKTGQEAIILCPENLLYQQYITDTINETVLNAFVPDKPYLALNGVDNSIDTGFNASTSGSAENMALVINIKNLAEGASFYSYILDTTNGAIGYYVRENSGILYVRFYTTTGTIDTRTEIELALIKQLAFSFQKNEGGTYDFRFYVNGDYHYQSLNIVSPLLLTNNNDVIGSEFNGTSGEIPVDVYSYARSSQALSLDEFDLFLQLDESIAYDYKVEMTDQTLTDTSGNEVVGTLNGVDTWSTFINQAIATGITEEYYIPIAQVVDFTQGGANKDVHPKLAAWQYGTITGFEGNIHFFELVYASDGTTVIGTKKHVIYNYEYTYNMVDYLGGLYYTFDKDLNIVGEGINLYDIVIAGGSDYPVGLNFNCRDCCKYERDGIEYRIIPENRRGRAYFFRVSGTSLIYEGNYIDLSVMGSSPECVKVLADGYLYATPDTRADVWKFSIGAFVGGDVNIGTYIGNFDVSGQVVQCTGIVQEDDGNVKLLSAGSLYEYNDAFVYEGTSESMAIYSGTSRGANNQSLDKRSDGVLITNAQNTNYVMMYDADVKCIKAKYQALTDSMIGVVVNETPLLTTCLTDALMYTSIFPDFAKKDSEGNYALDSEGNYIITADWYK